MRLCVSRIMSCGLIEIVLWLYLLFLIIIQIKVVVWLKSFFDYITSYPSERKALLWFDWNRSLTILVGHMQVVRARCGLIEIVLWLYYQAGPWPHLPRCGLIEIVLWLYWNQNKMEASRSCGLIEIVLWLYCNLHSVWFLVVVVWLKSFFDYIVSLIIVS